MTVRTPAVAGTFYPADPDILAATVDDLLRAAPARTVRAPVKALVVPHAGYVYSGAIAATGYSTFASQAAHRACISRVVLLGPAHHIPVRGLALPTADAFRTPLGDVAIDAPARDAVSQLPGVVVDDAPHAPEHSIEVHVPFLQRLFDDFALVPMVAGRAEPPTVAAVLETFWDDDETLVVVSTDLSHYEDYASAASHDHATATAMVRGDADAITPRDACGATPLRGLLTLARQRRVVPELLDLRSSGDTAGGRDRVVGYGAFSVARAA